MTMFTRNAGLQYIFVFVVIVQYIILNLFVFCSVKVYCIAFYEDLISHTGVIILILIH